MKKILITGLILLSVFIIYLANMDTKVYYLELGTKQEYSKDIEKYLKKINKLETYNDEYVLKSARITDIIKDIKNNKKGKIGTLKNALVKADITTIKIDASDIYEKINKEEIEYSAIYNYVDGLTKDLKKLLMLLRNYCKEDIFLIGYYNPYKENSDIQDVFDYLNKKYKEISNDYNIKYINIDNLKKSTKKEISNELIKTINKTTLNT